MIRILGNIVPQQTETIVLVDYCLWQTSPATFGDLRLVIQ